MAQTVVVDIFDEKDGTTHVRLRVREASDESREAVDRLMNIIMGKYPKRARFVDSTTVHLEAKTGLDEDSSN